MNLLQYVSDFRSKLLKACEAAKLDLKSTQGKMKQNYDKNTKKRSFKSGDKVLVFLSVPGRPLQARCFGPYTVEKKASDLNYIITTFDRRTQKQLCHINMLKAYVDSDSSNVAPGPEVIKLFSCSTQLSVKFFPLINVKMPAIVGILT